MDKDEIEKRVVAILAATGSSQAFLILLDNKARRAELVGATDPEDPATPADVIAMLQRLVEGLRDGDGMTIGRHGQTIKAPTDDSEAGLMAFLSSRKHTETGLLASILLDVREKNVTYYYAGPTELHSKVPAWLDQLAKQIAEDQAKGHT